MTVIIDYGVGNLFSLRSSFAAIGHEAVVSKDIEVIRKAKRLVLPGVGAFEDAVRKLRESGLYEEVKAQALSGKPLMGICLGMQMLFEKSYEYGEHEGLGLLKGNIVPFEGRIDSKLRIPNIGWSDLKIKKTDSPIFKYIKDGDFVYFVHSYFAADCDASVAATSEYGIEFTAAVSDGNIFGCQFHPEKSGDTGLAILRGFCEIGE